MSLSWRYWKASTTHAVQNRVVLSSKEDLKQGDNMVASMSIIAALHAVPMASSICELVLIIESRHFTASRLWCLQREHTRTQGLQLHVCLNTDSLCSSYAEQSVYKSRCICSHLIHNPHWNFEAVLFCSNNLLLQPSTPI